VRSTSPLSGMGEANGSRVLDVGDQAQVRAAGGEVAGVASQPQAAVVVLGQARAAASKVEAAAERLLSVAKEVREVRLRGARDVVTADVEGELRVLEDSLRDADASLRAAAERIEQAAKGVLSAGNRLPGATKPFPSKSLTVPGATEPFPPKSLTDIQSLLKLDRYPEHKKAWEEWQRKGKVLNSRVSRREARSADVTNQIFNIIGWYAVFLGVVLTAVSQLTQTASNVPVCGKIWFPILLTGFGTVVTICGIIYKYTTLKSLELTIQSEREASKVSTSMLSLVSTRIFPMNESVLCSFSSQMAQILYRSCEGLRAQYLKLQQVPGPPQTQGFFSDVSTVTIL
jgi:hypothetical protein